MTYRIEISDGQSRNGLGETTITAATWPAAMHKAAAWVAAGDYAGGKPGAAIPYTVTLGTQTRHAYHILTRADCYEVAP